MLWQVELANTELMFTVHIQQPTLVVASMNSGDRHLPAGMKHLLAGDKEQAAAAFRKCLEAKKPDFLEYRSAQAELETLVPTTDSSDQGKPGGRS